MSVREAFIKVCVDRMNLIAPSDDAEVIEARRQVAQSHIDQDNVAFTMFKAGHAAALSEKPTVYLDSSAQGVNLSAYPSEHADEQEWENYTFTLIEECVSRRPVRERVHSISAGVLRNVLERAGVRVVIE